jgi:hypothetical protein
VENEFLLSSGPSVEDLHHMARAAEGSPERFFCYYPVTPCGRSIRRVAVFTGVANSTQTNLVVDCVTELFDFDEIDEGEQAYANAQIIVELTRGGMMHLAYIVIDEGSQMESPHPLFWERPELITTGV